MEGMLQGFPDMDFNISLTQIFEISSEGAWKSIRKSCEYSFLQIKTTQQITQLIKKITHAFS